MPTPALLLPCVKVTVGCGIDTADGLLLDAVKVDVATSGPGATWFICASAKSAVPPTTEVRLLGSKLNDVNSNGGGVPGTRPTHVSPIRPPREPSARGVE